MPEISVNHAEQLRKISIRAEADGEEALGGSVDMKDFVNLEELEISNHGISSIKNYRPEQLEVFKVQNNHIKDELGKFGSRLRIVEIFNDDTCTPLGDDLSSNSFTGDLRSIILDCKDYLNVFDAHSDNATVKNDLSGLLPELEEYTNLREFDISDNVKVGGSIGDLSQCSFLTKFKAHNTSIAAVQDDFDLPGTLETFSLYNTPINADSINLVVESLGDTLGTIEVSGFTGSFTGANGTYTLFKYTKTLLNGQAVWEKGASAATPYRISYIGTEWQINDLSGGVTLATHADDTDIPPTSGWSLGTGTGTPALTYKTGNTVDVGPAGLITDLNFSRLNTIESIGFTTTVHSNSDLPLLNNNFAKEPTLALGLNKLTATASLALRMRRGWDDVEVDVGFDSNGKVSNSSPVSGATNGKTYVNAEEFLNEIFTQPYELPVVATNSSLNEVENFSASTNEDGTYNFAGTGTASAGTSNGRIVFVPKAGTQLVQEKDTARTQFRFTGNSTSTDTTNKYIFSVVETTNAGTGATYSLTNHLSSDNPRPELQMNLAATGSGALGEFEFIRSGMNDADTNGAGNYFNSDLGQFQIALGASEEVAVSNFKIEVIKHSACLTKWYDQGPDSYDFTQTNKDDQPFVAMDGSMLDSLSFAETFESDGGSSLVEGTDFLEAPSGQKIITGTEASDFSIFSVFGFTGTSDAGYLFGNGHNTTTGHNVYVNGDTVVALSLGSGAATISSTRLDGGSSFLDRLNLLSIINDGDGDNFIRTGPGNIGTITQPTGGGVTTVSAATEDFVIGNRATGSSETTFFKGRIKEIVIYDGSDKSVQRRAIEAEIIRRNELT